MNIYLIHITTFTCDIFSEGSYITDYAFSSESEAETYILENNLLEQGYCSVTAIKVKDS